MTIKKMIMSGVAKGWLLVFTSCNELPKLNEYNDFERDVRSGLGYLMLITRKNRSACVQNRTDSCYVLVRNIQGQTKI